MSQLRLHHVALWVDDLERMREFYVEALGGKSGSLYENPRTGFRSYFISFGNSQLELMWQPGSSKAPRDVTQLGYAHVAMSTGDRSGVDERVARLRAHGVRLVGEPRTTGDGYYEAIFEDPEGNRIELVE